MLLGGLLLFFFSDERTKLRAQQGAKREEPVCIDICLLLLPWNSVSELPSAVQIRRHTAQLIRLPVMFGILLRLRLWATGNLCGKFGFLCLFLRVNYKYFGSFWTAYMYSTGLSLLAGDRRQVTRVYDFRTFMNFYLTCWWTWCLDVAEQQDLTNNLVLLAFGSPEQVGRHLQFKRCDSQETAITTYTPHREGSWLEALCSPYKLQKGMKFQVNAQTFWLNQSIATTQWILCSLLLQDITQQ